MPLIVAHRINTMKQLIDTDPSFGVELDIHGYGKRIVVHHDALADGEDLEDWMKVFSHRLAIFNIKEEGIESKVVEMAGRHGINNFLMLDLSFPALVKMINCGENRVAVRVSEYEPVSGALSLAGKANWVWLDIFSGLSLTPQEYRALKSAGFQICLVSPELYPNQGEEEVIEIHKQLDDRGLIMDAVCTKRPDLWGWVL